MRNSAARGLQMPKSLPGSLPMTLRMYRRLARGLVPLAPALIKRRLKQGKEDPARVGERRGPSPDVRPHRPLGWVHGASVGGGLAAGGLISRLGGLNLRLLLTPPTGTPAPVVAKSFPPHATHP